MAVTRRTMSIQAVPLNDIRTATITIDLGKYYDEANTRIISAMMYATYTDLAAAAATIQIPCSYNFRDTNAMQLPDPQVTTTSGTAVTAFAAGGGFNMGQIMFEGYVNLESPIFEVRLDAYLPAVGNYSTSYVMTFTLLIQFEFGIDPISK